MYIIIILIIHSSIFFTNNLWGIKMKQKLLALLKQLLNKYFDLPEKFFHQDNKYLITASMFGIGYFKKSPGTFASVIALLIGILISSISAKLFSVVVILCIIVGFFVCHKVSNEDMKTSNIVIDEFAGQFIAMMLVPNSLYLCFISFIIFRILDIKKPSIIGMAKHSFPKGLAIMMDDIIAGFIALISVLLLSTIDFLNF